MALMLVLPTAHAANPPPPEMPPPAAQPIKVYDIELGEGWENWSWAKTELSLSLTGSARRPIKVEAEGWQALYLHHAPFDTTGLRKLNLLIQGSVPDREVRIFMLSEGKPIGEGKPVKFGNAGWTRVEVPLVTLGAEDKVVDGIWVQNSSAEVLPKFYVTEITID
jgi:hypothetical protein